jgi:hypothetical protein
MVGFYFSVGDFGTHGAAKQRMIAGVGDVALRVERAGGKEK